MVATYAIGISGASRELTEGFGWLLAAVILLWVGIWMHGKAQAAEWRRYIAARRCRAPCRAARPGSCSAWPSSSSIARCSRPSCSMRALWTPDNGATILAGALTAVALLAAIAWAMLRYSRTLPIGPVLPLQRDPHRRPRRGLGRQGHRRAPGSRMMPSRHWPASRASAMLGLFPTRAGGGGATADAGRRRHRLSRAARHNRDAVSAPAE